MFGLASIILGELLKVYNLNENTPENVNLISLVLEEFIFKCLKENQDFEIKYLESDRFNFNEITEERQIEYIEFIHDYRRFVNKSLKVLIDKNQMNKQLLDLMLSALVGLYFKNRNSIPAVEIDPENQDPEYIEKIKQEQEEYSETVARLETIKKKIKFIMIKPTILKKRRDNMAAFIQVNPALSVKDTVTETDEIPASERPKTTMNSNKKSEADNINAVSENVNAESNQENEGNENNNDGNDIQNNEDNNNKENNDNENKAINEAEKESEKNKNEEEQKGNADQESKITEENNDENTKQQNSEEGKGAENSNSTNKNHLKMFKIEYFNEAQIFKNSNMKYEPYIIHHKLHEYSMINIAKSFRKVIKKNLKIDADLNELINVSNNAYNKHTQYVIDWIMNNEIYIQDTIVPIVSGPLETKTEEISAPETKINNPDVPENPENPDILGNNPEPSAVQE